MKSRFVLSPPRPRSHKQAPLTERLNFLIPQEVRMFEDTIVNLSNEDYHRALRLRRLIEGTTIGERRASVRPIFTVVAGRMIRETQPEFEVMRQTNSHITVRNCATGECWDAGSNGSLLLSICRITRAIFNIPTSDKERAVLVNELPPAEEPLDE